MDQFIIVVKNNVFQPIGQLNNQGITSVNVSSVSDNVYTLTEAEYREYIENRARVEEIERKAKEERKNKMHGTFFIVGGYRYFYRS